MKRICWLLVFVLILSCVPAMAAEGDAILGRTDDEETMYFSYCFADGDTLYLTGYDALYSFHIGDTDLQEYFLNGGVNEVAEDEVILLPFADGGKLQAIALISTMSEDSSDFKCAKLVDLELQGDTISYVEKCDIDWSNMVDYYENTGYPIRPEAVIGVGGKAIMRIYDNKGNNKISMIDLQSGAIRDLDELTDICSFTQYKDNTLLLVQYNYETGGETARLLVFDPADETVQQLAEVRVKDYSPLQGLAYNSADDTIYCAASGEICPVNLETGEIGDGVTDMPLDTTNSVAGGCILEGGYYALANEGAVIRNLDPSQQATSRLKISDSTWSENVSNAYYRFSNAHGDVGVILSREYTESENLIENMMNRDDSIDIYIINGSSSEYEALFNRGYMLELTGNESIDALANSMYPSLKEALSVNGELAAIPVAVYGSTVGIGNEALKALGLTIDDVPTNWVDFLDFLDGLTALAAQNDKVRIFNYGYSDADVRNMLFFSIFTTYQRYVTRNDPSMGYNTELLNYLMTRMEQIDYVALGCMTQEEVDMDMMSMVSMEDNRPVLIQPEFGCTIGNMYGDITPVLMSIDANSPAYLDLEATVAFVNPFTKNPEAAIAFMGELVDSMDDITSYDINPSLNEPIRGKWNEQAIEETRKTIEEMSAQLEKADPVDRQMLEQEIKNLEENLETLDKEAWDVSPSDLEWYRAHDDNVVLAPSNWLYQESDDDSGVGEAWTLISQYQDGLIGIDELLASIDKKVQMMLLEGN